MAATGRTAHAASCDLGDAGAIAGYIADAARALGGIDILVNNASGFGNSDDEAGWSASMAIDMMAIVHATQAALPFLKRGREHRQHLLDIGDAPGGAAASDGAIKAAVIYYTTTQAAMYARDGVRANAIAPGSIEFPGGVWDRRKSEAPELYHRVHRSILFGRMGMPEEVAHVAVFLASPLAVWVTGQVIAVDGGQLLGS